MSIDDDPSGYVRFPNAPRPSDTGGPFQGPPAKRVLVGNGDVVESRYWKALVARGRPERLAVCGLEPNPKLNSIPYDFFAVDPEKGLPLATLDQAGFTGGSVSFHILTPSEWHLPYAVQASALGTVAASGPRRFRPPRPASFGTNPVGPRAPAAGRFACLNRGLVASSPKTE